MDQIQLNRSFDCFSNSILRDAIPNIASGWQTFALDFPHSTLGFAKCGLEWAPVTEYRAANLNIRQALTTHLH